jgi:hypothetical protein
MGVSPTTLSFGNQTVGTTSATQTVTISNTGNAALTVNSISNGNATDFALTSTATPFNVAAGASQTFTVAFKPATTGAKSATISITSDGGNGSVSASGTGTTTTPPPPGGDVALTKLVVPAKVSARSSKSLEIDAFATTTVKEVKATVNLAASPGSGVTVKMEHASVTETLKSERAKKLGFQARITCTKKGTWPVNWTAKISAAQNSDPANDTLTGTTQVTCNGSSHDD